MHGSGKESHTADPLKACHGGLVDGSLFVEEAAGLELLLERIDELDLSSRESHEKTAGSQRCRVLVEVVAGRVGPFVHALVNRLREIGRAMHASKQPWRIRYPTTFVSPTT